MVKCKFFSPVPEALINAYGSSLKYAICCKTYKPELVAEQNCRYCKELL